MTTETAVMPLESMTFPGPTGYLTIVTTGEIAPRPNGKDLFFKIEVGSDTATFHCRVPEHVGTGKQRKVTFLADKNCTLEFDNEVVFGTKAVRLVANKPEALNVADGLTNVGTDYFVPNLTTNGAQPVAAVKNAPKIVVP